MVKRIEYESSLLARIANSLVDTRVKVQLINGTTIVGTMEPCTLPLRTVSIKEASCQVYVASEGLTKLPQLHLEALPQCSQDAHCQGCMRPTNFINLVQGIMDLKGHRVFLDRQCIREDFVANLVPAKMNKTQRGAFPLSSVHALKRSILREHRDAIKNQAFEKCNRIGNAGTLNNCCL
ncbi:hypothetical protein BdWA1_001274 [Babesia duncani]|uniref:Uncharacterized protein n=1 Tax=Babesia duncani TaxID=323732 RepID=A0AAD9UQT6_9APIC|nr:hypothetical protein BdWA1_001274 [Babesia duncani]